MMIERDDELDDDKILDDADADESETLDEADADESESDGETPAADDDEGELVVTIGDEQPEVDESEKPGAPQWVKDLRKSDRDKTKRIRELEAKLGGGNGQPARKTLGPKPKLADSDYDESKHEAALDAWYEAKREAEAAERAAVDSQTAQQREWDSRLQNHVKAKGALKVKGYDEAEETVFDELDQTQQGIIISGAKNSALLVLALAKNPKELKRLSAIKDPVQYTFEVARLETKLKTTKRRPTTAPEGTVERGNAGGANTGNAQLERLRAAAEKSGDYSKVHEFRRKLRERKRA